MTNPTPAQIEAAAKVLACHDKHIDKITQADINAWKAEAELALTAAAEVGDTEIDRLHGIIKDLDGAIDKLEHEKSATKERCAQVVDSLIKKANRGAIAALEEAAAEIRKLPL